VYAASHKFHHEIRDTTAFDTGFGNVGLPELMFRPAWDVLALMVRGTPPTLCTYNYLFYALMSKVAHGNNDDAPYHWEHHMYFSVNLDDHRLSLMDVMCGTFRHPLPHQHTYGYWIGRRGDTDDGPTAQGEAGVAGGTIDVDTKDDGPTAHGKAGVASSGPHVVLWVTKRPRRPHKSKSIKR
jgi:hypothetical protein